MATSAMDRTTSPFPAENGADTGKDDDDSEPKMPQFDPGELAPFWASPHEPAQLSDDAEKQLRALCDLVGNKDVAAQALGGGAGLGGAALRPWLPVPAAAQGRRLGDAALCHQLQPRRQPEKRPEVVRLRDQYLFELRRDHFRGLTRDIPAVRFEPQNPTSDSCPVWPRA